MCCTCCYVIFNTIIVWTKIMLLNLNIKIFMVLLWIEYWSNHYKIYKTLIVKKKTKSNIVCNLYARMGLCVWCVGSECNMKCISVLSIDVFNYFWTRKSNIIVVKQGMPLFYQIEICVNTCIYSTEIINIY